MTATSYTRGVNRQLIIGKQSALGTLALANSGKLLRRVNASPNLMRDAFTSQEILPSHQLRDARLGTIRTPMTLSGQFAPGAYVDFIEGMVRRTFTAGVSATGMTVTAVAGPPGTFTRAAGSWLTDGFKVGDVVRYTGFTAGAAGNNARNYRIIDLTATIMTVTGIGLEVVAAAASAPTIGCSVVGKKTFIPATGHIFNAYTVEDLKPDASPLSSHRYQDMRMQALAIRLPATGIATLEAQLVGRQRLVGTTAYFTAPTAMTTDNSFAAVSGTLRLAGADIATVTGLTLQLSCPIEAPACVGTNLVPDNFQGMLSMRAQASMLFTDDTFTSNYDAETEFDLAVELTSDSTVNSAFVAIVMNRVKIMALQTNDSDRSLIQTMEIVPLEHIVGAGAGTKYEGTTVSFQDSAA
jgi:hypothetical protein